MDSLLAGTLILPWKGHCAGYVVQRRCAGGNHSGLSGKPFRDQAKTVRLPAGITVRLQPGILFVFTPESFSRSPRNPVRLAPESAVIEQTAQPRARKSPTSHVGRPPWGAPISVDPKRTILDDGFGMSRISAIKIAPLLGVVLIVRQITSPVPNRRVPPVSVEST